MGSQLRKGRCELKVMKCLLISMQTHTQVCPTSVPQSADWSNQSKSEQCWFMGYSHKHPPMQRLLFISRICNCGVIGTTINHQHTTNLSNKLHLTKSLMKACMADGFVNGDYQQRKLPAQTGFYLRVCGQKFVDLMF